MLYVTFVIKGSILLRNYRKMTIYRVLTNSKLGLFYSNFLILTPPFKKVPIEKYGKTPSFSGKQHFYSYFQYPGENSVFSHFPIFPL